MEWVKKNKRKINIFNDPKKAAKNADVVFSDKVVSLNDKVNKTKKTRTRKRTFSSKKRRQKKRNKKLTVKAA